MDLISQISAQLGVDPAQAQALAGTVLGTVKTQVAENVGEEAAGALDAQVPELGGWQQQATQAASAAAGGGLLGGLAGGLGGSLLGAVGGEEAKQAAQIASLIQSFGLDASKATMVGPLVLAFLKDRMSAEWLDKALAVAPLLAGGQADSGGIAGAAMGALGGMFGGE